MTEPPVSVLLPTVRWTPACSEVADQLADEDELLVVCDEPTDPVGQRDRLPDGVRVVVAGTPDGCSGKANAIDAGIAAARHDRLVWTDDDFRHPSDWLARLRTDYTNHGPVAEVPVFRGLDPLAVLLEPAYILAGSLWLYAGDAVWGGAVVFDRSDVDLDAFRAALCRTVSDDGLLSEYLDVTTLKRPRMVPAGGSLRATLERHVRFVQIARFHGPRYVAPVFAVLSLLSVACLALPLPTLGLVTLFGLCGYAFLGVRRWTFLLAYPAAVVGPALFAYALARRTFVWGGRRYRWRSKFDVHVFKE